MPKGLRFAVPLCEEQIVYQCKERKSKVVTKCNKTAVAHWVWSECGGEPFYVCAFHDKPIQLEETGQVIKPREPEIFEYKERHVR